MGSKRAFTVVIERGKDGWLVADVPELEACHTHAKSMDELLKGIKEVIDLCSNATTLKLWKEDNRSLIRNHEHRINTFGNNLEEALNNFYEAYSLNTENN